MTNSRDGGIGSDDDPTLGADGSWTQVGQSHFDPEEDGDLTTVLVIAIAEVHGIDPTELTSPILYDVVDAPAIQEAFFGSNASGTFRSGTGSAEFRYGDYLVKVRSDGWIQIYR